MSKLTTQPDTLPDAHFFARMKDKPVFVLVGTGVAHHHRQICCMDDLTTVEAAKVASRQAYQRAGIGPSEIDLLQLYDAFTINPILFSEDLGFCAKGEGGSFVTATGIGPGGKLPVNSNGGGLSCVHPGMYSMFRLVEAVRQLRGECGERQVAGPSIALVHGNGGVLSARATTILSNQR